MSSSPLRAIVVAPLPSSIRAVKGMSPMVPPSRRLGACASSPTSDRGSGSEMREPWIGVRLLHCTPIQAAAYR